MHACEKRNIRIRLKSCCLNQKQFVSRHSSLSHKNKRNICLRDWERLCVNQAANSSSQEERRSAVIVQVKKDEAGSKQQKQPGVKETLKQV